ncbi:MAG: insulinase family protein [Proteobacteria bacterium]|nr:insulinase family protein [Pseudomonadota bacterium]
MPARRTDLDFGVVVVSDAMPGVEGTSLGLYFPTGSRHETPETNGIAHFIEHLVFKGTSTRSADAINREIDLLGGGSNAYTTKEHTCLHARVLSENLDRAMHLLADLVTAGLPEGIGVEVERERGVILSEIRSAEDTPEDLVSHLIDQALYGEHPLAMPVTGSVEVVEKLDLARLRTHYRERLASSPLVVSAAGKLDHERLVARTAELLGGRRTQSLPLASPAPPLQPGRRIVERDLEQVHLSLSAPGVSARDPRWAAAELLSIAVGDGYSSRLFREVRDRRGLAYAIYTSLVSYLDTGSFNVDCAVAPGKLAEAFEVILGVLAGVRDRGIEDDELEAAKQQLRSSLLLGHEATGARMSYLADQVLSGEENLELERDLEAVDSVGGAEVRDLAGELFSAPLALAAVGPRCDGALPGDAFELPG